MIYYKCNICDNILGSAEDKDVKVSCCEHEMEKLVPNTVDASVEKHMPVVEVNGNIVKVTVGETLHPMSAEHNISWVAINTDQGRQRKNLTIDSDPVIEFALVEGDRLHAVCAYCNLHGLWKLDV